MRLKKQTDKPRYDSKARCAKCGKRKGNDTRYPLCRVCGIESRRTKVSTEVFYVKGKPCRYYPLTRGQKVVVNIGWYRRLVKMNFPWTAQRNSYGDGFNAVYHNVGRGISISMHGLIAGVPEGSGLEADHINHDTLDNRTQNLRIGTKRQNCYNRTLRKDNKSGYKGVCLDKKRGLWIVQINIDGKNTYLGSYRSKIEAAHIYDAAAIKHHGKFAYINFPHQ